MMFGSAESERPTLTNREIIFEEFRPIRDHNPPTSQTDGQTDGRKDDMRSQDRALQCIARKKPLLYFLLLFASVLQAN